MLDSDLVVLPPRPRYAAKEWLTRKEAAILLESVGCPRSPAYLAKLSNLPPPEGPKGPPLFKSGSRTIRYRRDDVVAWALKQMVRRG